MKKIRNILFICTIILIGLFTVKATYAGYKTDADPKTKKTNKNVFVDKSAKKSRKVKLDKRNREVLYKRTHVIEENELTNNKDVEYGSYDTYTDSNDNEYIYLSGTDKYCGFRESNIGTSEVDMIVNENEARKIAKDYIKDVNDRYNEYKLEQVIYQDWGYYYDAYFNLYVNEEKTNEVVRVWVNTEGRVISYSDFLIDCFDNVSTDCIDVEEVKDETEDKIKDKLEGSEFNIDDQYIKYEDGNLVLETKYSTFLTNGLSEVKYEDTITIPIEE